MDLLVEHDTKNVRFLCLHLCLRCPENLDDLDTCHIINVHLSNCAFSGTESYEISWKLTGQLHGMCTGFLTSLDRMYFLNRNTNTCDIGCNRGDTGLSTACSHQSAFAPGWAKKKVHLGKNSCFLGALVPSQNNIACLLQEGLLYNTRRKIQLFEMVSLDQTSLFSLSVFTVLT